MKLYETNREVEWVSSVEAAVDAVSETGSGETICDQIVASDGTVVYDSDRNRPIDEWKASRLEHR
ncbi:hypothetical protein GCM10025298_27330 [Natronobiforma cellulositropha]